MGLRAEIRIGSPQDCPVACVSGEKDLRTGSVSRAYSPSSSVVTEEVVFDSADVQVEEGDSPPDGFEEVFSYDTKTVYRFSREEGRGCACECVEEFGYPVVDSHTRDGDLFLAFHAPDTDALKQVMNDLNRRYSDVELKRLVESGDGEDDSLVLVDKGELTEKQEEALRTAHEMGYFEHPKGANAGEVADELGVATSTFTEHLSAAQRKLMRSIVDG